MKLHWLFYLNKKPGNGVLNWMPLLLVVVNCVAVIIVVSPKYYKRLSPLSNTVFLMSLVPTMLLNSTKRSNDCQGISLLELLWLTNHQCSRCKVTFVSPTAEIPYTLPPNSLVASLALLSTTTANLAPRTTKGLPAPPQSYSSGISGTIVSDNISLRGISIFNTTTNENSNISFFQSQKSSHSSSYSGSTSGDITIEHTSLWGFIAPYDGNSDSIDCRGSNGNYSGESKAKFLIEDHACWMYHMNFLWRKFFVSWVEIFVVLCMKWPFLVCVVWKKYLVVAFVLLSKNYCTRCTKGGEECWLCSSQHCFDMWLRENMCCV